jgi:hypothetical protein
MGLFLADGKRGIVADTPKSNQSPWVTSAEKFSIMALAGDFHKNGIGILISMQIKAGYV